MIFDFDFDPNIKPKFNKEGYYHLKIIRFLHTLSGNHYVTVKSRNNYEKNLKISANLFHKFAEYKTQNCFVLYVKDYLIKKIVYNTTTGQWVNIE